MELPEIIRKNGYIAWKLERLKKITTGEIH